jgi:trk system potassium uptake protein
MSKKFVVIGLGHFGSHLASELTSKGAEVLAIDKDLEKLEDIKDFVTHCIKLDSTEEKSLKNQAVYEYDAVIVSIGDDFEASILTIAMLQKLEVKRIIVRATTSNHEKILRHLGVSEIILPAEEAADKLANSLLMENVLDVFSLSSDYTIIESQVPQQFIGKKIEDLNLPLKFNVSIITIKRFESRNPLLGLRSGTIEKILGIPSPQLILGKDDILVLFGKQKEIEKMLKNTNK